MPNPIPKEQALAVSQRERYQCLRCSGNGTDRHHRRRRNVGDQHQHCLCNLVLLCRHCHNWAHANVTDAQAAGLIVSSYTTEPGTVPALSFRGPALLGCDGSKTQTGESK